MNGFIEFIRHMLNHPALPEWFGVMFYVQLLLAGYFVVFVFFKKKVVSVERFPFVYKTLYPLFGTIAFITAQRLSWEYGIVNLNNLIYGFKAGIMGYKGVMEELILTSLFFMPLLTLLTFIFRVQFKCRKRYAIFHLTYYAVNFLVWQLTVDLWFPPLINYGSAF